MNDPFLKTKLLVPAPGPDFIPRGRLYDLLNEGARRPLTLLSAPAGYGKTMLLADWARRNPWPVAWVSLDDGDNEPVRFFTCLGKAITAALPGQDHPGLQSILSSLQSPRPFSGRAFISALINDLCEGPAELILLLDDYHFISGQVLHEALAYLLDHMPPRLHLLIATRSDPPLPLGRLRARGQMLEIRTADLQFTSVEAVAFLNRALGEELNREDLARLEARTEGWIAGLRMAALSLQGRKDRRAFIKSFSGSHRYIMEFLLEEVLEQQPPEIQQFLIRTSILERLNGALCDALLMDEEGRITEGEMASFSFSLHPSALILDQLLRSNLFITALDEEHSWFRYHPLFADLLQARLQNAQPARLPALHARASRWYESAGFDHEAIRHALSARDYARAAALLETCALRVLYRGEFTSFRNWFQALPEEVAQTRPLLCVYHASGLSLTGRTGEVEKWLRAAEKQLPSAALSPADQMLFNQILALRVHVADMEGEVERTVELARLADQTLPAGDLANRTLVNGMLGHARFLQGHLEEAYGLWSAAVQASEATENLYGVMVYTAQLAKICKVEGRLQQAHALYTQALRFAESRGRNPEYAMGSILIGLGDLLREWNALDEARQSVQEGLRQSELFEIPTPVAAGYAVLVQILVSSGELDRAEEAAARALPIIQGSGVWQDVLSQFEASQVRLWLANGDLKRAGLWELERRSGLEEPCAFSQESDGIALARLWIARKEYEQAARLLERLARSAGPAGRTGRLIEILALQALSQKAQGANEQALNATVKCLSLAEPERYVRVFLDEGAPMRELLVAAGAHFKADQGLAAYLERLLAAFPPLQPLEMPPRAGVLPFQHSGQDDLYLEPLSERELEILRLICQGYSNQAIAETLVITYNTVKKHNSHIFGKLGVANRAQAILRAQQQGFFKT